MTDSTFYISALPSMASLGPMSFVEFKKLPYFMSLYSDEEEPPGAGRMRWRLFRWSVGPKESPGAGRTDRELGTGL